MQHCPSRQPFICSTRSRRGASASEAACHACAALTCASPSAASCSSVGLVGTAGSAAEKGLCSIRRSSLLGRPVLRALRTTFSAMSICTRDSTTESAPRLAAGHDLPSLDTGNARLLRKLPRTAGRSFDIKALHIGPTPAARRLTEDNMEGPPPATPRRSPSAGAPGPSAPTQRTRGVGDVRVSRTTRNTSHSHKKVVSS